MPVYEMDVEKMDLNLTHSHWHLDAAFLKNHNQTLENTAAENMNILRKWTISMLKSLEVDKKYSLKKKQFVTGVIFRNLLIV